MPLLVAITAVLFGGCARRLCVVSEHDFLRLTPCEMAVEGDKCQARLPLPRRQMARVVRLMQRRDMDPVYRGYLWQLLLKNGGPHLAERHRELWFINKEEMDATRDKRHTGGTLGSIDRSFWRRLQSQTGLRIAVWPELQKLYDGSKKGRGAKVVNAPTFFYITMLCHWNGIATDFIFGYGTLLVCGCGEEALAFFFHKADRQRGGERTLDDAYEQYVEMVIPGIHVEAAEAND